ncbi:MAG: shikimate dehydrogenase [Verrucomicrobia bacterium]|nr:shikimate dehydrogenase [Verrucomicrobiota bacterium]
MLVGVILGPSAEEVLQEIEEIHSKVDVVELRLDHFDDSALQQLDLIHRKISVPTIFTFRKREQGGQKEISEEERLELFEEALNLEPAFADIEADTEPSFAAKMAELHPNVMLIGSHHDFEKTPEDLQGLLQSMKQKPFAMYKIALKARSTLDLMRLMVFAKEMAPKVPLSCLSMGEYGQPSRVMGPVVGNVLNYTSLRDQVGPLFQLNLDTLNDLYRIRHLTQGSKIFALLGDPIEGSQGHIFHNEIFKNEGINAVYVKLRLPAADLEKFFALVPKLPFGGFSVTIPLKEAILPFLSQIDSTAKAIGAVNTVTVQGPYTFGTNTDASGALNAIELHGKVEGKRVAVLGAGGAARAIAYEAMQRGAEVAIFNRTPERGVKMAQEFGCRAFALDEIGAHPYDILVSTIPPHPEGQLPIPTTAILPKSLVMEINNRPAEPPLLQAAKEKGCRCVYGKEMFVEQGHMQQLLWKKRHVFEKG